MNQPASTTSRTLLIQLKNLTHKVWPAIQDIFGSEVYVYASAIAFNAMLSFLPFSILILSFCKDVLEWPSGYEAALRLLSEYLPTGQEFIIRNLKVMLRARREAPALSMLLLIFTSMGTLLPVELALNRAWAVGQNRKFLNNQITSFLLILGCGGLTLGAVGLLVAAQGLIAATAGRFSEAMAQTLAGASLKLIAFILATSIFLLIYYALPNRKVKLAQIMPAAIFSGALWEGARYIFTWILPLLQFQKSFGPFSISITLIIGAYISSLIMLLGANLSAQNLLPPLAWRKGSESKTVRD